MQTTFLIQGIFVVIPSMGVFHQNYVYGNIYINKVVRKLVSAACWKYVLLTGVERYQLTKYFYKFKVCR